MYCGFWKVKVGQTSDIDKPSNYPKPPKKMSKSMMEKYFEKMKAFCRYGDI